jgi:hypothetical protein
MAHVFAQSTIEAFMQTSCLQGSNDYWNIDDILSEEEFVPCTFKVNAKGLGYLNLLESFSGH